MSLHIAIFGRRQIVIAADSRDTAPGNVVVGDDAQKLFRCGERTVCGITGATFLGPEPCGRVSGPVAEICARTELQDSPRELLDAIQTELYDQFARTFDQRPANDSPALFSAFVIRKRPSGAVDLLELEFPVLNDGSRPLLDEPVLKVHAEDVLPRGPFMFSMGSLVAQELAFNPDVPDPDVLAGFDRVFDALRAEDYMGAALRIGGPIDVCAIDAEGFRWLRRKPEAVIPVEIPAKVSASPWRPVWIGPLIGAAGYAIWKLLMLARGLNP